MAIYRKVTTCSRLHRGDEPTSHETCVRTWHHLVADYGSTNRIPVDLTVDTKQIGERAPYIESVQLTVPVGIPVSAALSEYTGLTETRRADLEDYLIKRQKNVDRIGWVYCGYHFYHEAKVNLRWFNGRDLIDGRDLAGEYQDGGGLRQYVLDAVADLIHMFEQDINDWIANKKGAQQ